MAFLDTLGRVNIEQTSKLTSRREKENVVNKMIDPSNYVTAAGQLGLGLAVVIPLVNPMAAATDSILTV